MTLGDPFGLRLYLALSAVVAPLARRHLRRRLARGREDPARWQEKLGVASADRPDGPLVWIHAVGVGEVLALPGLVTALRALRPDVRVLITSSSRTSATALARNLPEGAVHQFLPLDARPFVTAFLNHWRPDLAVWAERDIWPGLVVQTARRAVPQVMVNGRMNAASHAAKARAGRLFAALFGRFLWVGVQDRATAGFVAALGVDPARVHLDGSLKAGAAPLADLPEQRAAWQATLAGRFVWMAASSHAEDEAAALESHRALLAQDPQACLILAPRVPDRAAAVLEQCRAAGFSATLAEQPGLAGQVLVVPVIGQMGLWYRLAQVALVGGSIAAVGGHNPYEPARLGCAILHGPHVANFADDYAAFDAAGAARCVQNAAELAAALRDPSVLAGTGSARALAEAGRAGVHRVAARLAQALQPMAQPAARERR